MCRFFHKWGKWEVIHEQAFIAESSGYRKVVLTQKRVCSVCNKTEIDVKTAW